MSQALKSDLKKNTKQIMYGKKIRSQKSFSFHVDEIALI
jgi:hypothetical protein